MAGRPKGSKNKSTLARENVLTRASGGKELVVYDSLHVMQDCMNFFYRRYLALVSSKKTGQAHDEKLVTAARYAFTYAERFGSFKHPRMATMKGSHDSNAGRPLDQMTKDELRAQVMRELAELGVNIDLQPQGVIDLQPQGVTKN
jgi:hypothetical protein